MWSSVGEGTEAGGALMNTWTDAARELFRVRDIDADARRIIFDGVGCGEFLYVEIKV